MQYEWVSPILRANLAAPGHSEAPHLHSETPFLEFRAANSSRHQSFLGTGCRVDQPCVTPMCATEGFHLFHFHGVSHDGHRLREHLACVRHLPSHTFSVPIIVSHPQGCLGQGSVKPRASNFGSFQRPWAHGMLAFQHRFLKPGFSGEMAPSHDQSGGPGGGTCGSEHGTIVEVPKEVVSERPATSSPGIFAPSRCVTLRA